MADANILDANAIADLNQPTAGWQMPELPDLSMLTEVFELLQSTFGSFFQNVNPAEWALIGSLIFGLLLVLRFKVIVHLLLWVIAGGIVIAVAGIVFGVINI